MRPIPFGPGWIRYGRRLGLLLLLPLLTGCGAGKVKIKGQVTYDGKPLPGGFVKFFPENSNLPAVQADLDEQGNYEAELPIGEVTIAVDNLNLMPPPPDEGPKGLPLSNEDIKRLGMDKSRKAPEKPAPNQGGKHYVPIPPHYAKPETSGLTYKVESGSETLNIPLQKPAPEPKPRKGR
jgi:hypothetical protein